MLVQGAAGRLQRPVLDGHLDLDLRPLTVAPSAGEVILIADGAEPPQDANSSDRPSSMDARTGIRAYREIIMEPPRILRYNYAEK